MPFICVKCNEFLKQDGSNVDSGPPYGWYKTFYGWCKDCKAMCGVDNYDVDWLMDVERDLEKYLEDSDPAPKRDWRDRIAISLGEPDLLKDWEKHTRPKIVDAERFLKEVRQKIESLKVHKPSPRCLHCGGKDIIFGRKTGGSSVAFGFSPPILHPNCGGQICSCSVQLRAT